MKANAPETTLSVEYDLSAEDLLAFHDYHQRHFSGVKQPSKWWWLFVVVLVAALAVRFVFPDTSEKDSLLFSMGPWIGVFLVLWAYFFWKVRRIRHRQVVSQLESRSLEGRKTLKIGPEGLCEISRFSNTSVAWAGIERVVSTDKHIFIYLGTLTAYIIAKRCFASEDAFHQFFEAVRNYHHNACPGRCAKCGYDLFGNTTGRCPECGTEIPAIS